MKKKILCVDDVKTNLLTIKSLMEDLAEDKYELVLALSALEGLEILLEQSIDIILLDVMMPEIDGFECAKMIKSNKKTKNIPIIFVTANKDDDTIEQCFKVGGDDYVSKPFNHTELLARISFHLKSREQDQLLLQEKEYIQSILDLQENMILVTDGKKNITVNHAFLEFFNVKNPKEFNDKYISIANTFLKEDGYFSLSSLEPETTCADEIIKRSQEEDVLVKIALDGSENIFNLKATAFLDQYILTLTDITQVSQLSLEYKREASYDSLTQIYNRNMFGRLIDIKMSKVKENSTPLVFIILDIDYFKKVNDTYGHLVGDEILKQLARLIQLHTRDNDLFARWGGEEFVLAFDLGIKKGVEIANNLRIYIEEEIFDVVEHITCSFGVTEFRIGDSLDSMILRADEALYRAKDNGRNQVCKA